MLYLMDAQWDFPMATGLVESQADDGFIPQMIVVEILLPQVLWQMQRKEAYFRGKVLNCQMGTFANL